MSTNTTKATQALMSFIKAKGISLDDLKDVMKITEDAQKKEQTKIEAKKRKVKAEARNKLIEIYRWLKHADFSEEEATEFLSTPVQKHIKERLEEANIKGEKKDRYLPKYSFPLLDGSYTEFMSERIAMSDSDVKEAAKEACGYDSAYSWIRVEERKAEEERVVKFMAPELVKGAAAAKKEKKEGSTRTVSKYRFPLGNAVMSDPMVLIGRKNPEHPVIKACKALGYKNLGEWVKADNFQTIEKVEETPL